MTDWLYAEQILHVDLTAQSARVEPTSVELKRDYVGGAGFVARLLAEPSVAAGDVALASGPLSDGMAGRLAMGAAPDGSLGGGGRHRLALSSMGGKMAAGLKAVGYDALVVTGRLTEPGFLFLDAGDVRILPAADAWGASIPCAQASLHGKCGSGLISMLIGPAAENGVPFATLGHDGHFAGGSGVAASFGAKRLKGILMPEPYGVPSRCTGCTLVCPGSAGPEARLAGDLGLDAPTAARLAALAEGCVEAGLLPTHDETYRAIAHRTGIGNLLADGETAAVSRLGPEAARIAAALPPLKKRGGIGVADLLGTCQRLWRDRPGQVLRQALSSTLGLVAS